MKNDVISSAGRNFLCGTLIFWKNEALQKLTKDAWRQIIIFEENNILRRKEIFILKNVIIVRKIPIAFQPAPLMVPTVCKVVIYFA